MSDFTSHIVQEANGQHFKCSKCGTSTRIYRASRTILFACPSCRKIYSNTDYELYQKIPNQPTLKTRKDLPALGSKGKLGDRSYTVIGIANKREKHNAYGIWKEIVLADEFGTIHFLNCSYGNYTMLTEDHNVNASAILKSIDEKYEHDGLKFQFFSTYNYETSSFVGEFHYDVVDVKRIKCYDYLSPPHIISVEQEDKKAPVAFRGRHMSRKEVARMFSDEAIANQNYEGIGMAQPFYGGLNMRRFNLLSFAFLVSLVLIGIFTGTSSEGNFIVVNKTLTNLNTEENFVSSPFKIYENRAPAYLKVETSAGLSNEWVETQITLVNEETGEEREYALGIEYYSGVDNGYSWSEGSQVSDLNISSVAAGKYHLKGKIMYSALSAETSYRLAVSYADPTAWNIGAIFIPYLVLLAVLNILKRQFERMRTGEIDNLFGSSYSE